MTNCYDYHPDCVSYGIELTTFWLFTGLTLALVAGCLFMEWRGQKVASGVFKTLASTAFMWMGVEHGLLDSCYGKWVFAALVGSWLGDVLLISNRPKFFLGGLVAFLLAHVAYIGAFLELGVDTKTALMASAPLLLVLAVVGRWLLPNVPKEMKAPVLVYMLVITAMVSCSFAVAESQRLYVSIAAVVFYASDLAVARNRFVCPGIQNRLWGLPAYYIAQCGFILSVYVINSALWQMTHSVAP